MLRAQLAAALDGYEVAETIINDEPDEARREDIALAVRRITANRTNDLVPLVSFLNDRYERTKELTDTDVVTAMDLGFRLGLDARLGPLMSKVHLLSEKQGSPISAYPISDVKRWLEKERQDRAEAEKVHGEGAVPLHLVTNRLRVPFAALLCEQGPN